MKSIWMVVMNLLKWLFKNRQLLKSHLDIIHRQKKSTEKITERRETEQQEQSQVHQEGGQEERNHEEGNKTMAALQKEETKDKQGEQDSPKICTQSGNKNSIQYDSQGSNLNENQHDKKEEK